MKTISGMTQRNLTYFSKLLFCSLLQIHRVGCLRSWSHKVLRVSETHWGTRLISMVQCIIALQWCSVLLSELALLCSHSALPSWVAISFKVGTSYSISAPRAIAWWTSPCCRQIPQQLHRKEEQSNAVALGWKRRIVFELKPQRIF